MTIRNLFEEQGVEETIQRINKLTPNTQAQWGKMSVSQMMAHVNVPYEQLYTDKFPRPGGFTRFLAKLLAKKQVVGPKPYPKNGRTAPDFIITGERDFEVEKNKLVSYIMKTKKMGTSHFDNKESQSLGKLSVHEWNVLFSKHIDHHLTQFGV